MNTKVYFVDHLIAKQGVSDELMKAFKPLAEACLKDKNCLTYEVYRDTRNKHSFVLYESWTSQEDYSAYLATVTPEHKALVAKRNALLEKGIDFDQTFKRVV